MQLTGADSTRFHNAVVSGDIETIRALLGGPPWDGDPPEPVGVGHPLTYAVYHGPVSLLEAFLAAGVSPRFEDAAGFPPLIAAMTSGRADAYTLVRMLLEAGADPDERGVNGYAPLHHAAAAGDEGLVALLLEHGADATLRTGVDDDETPADFARGAGHEDIARRLAAAERQR
mgnify:CR=1 FL=1